MSGVMSLQRSSSHFASCSSPRSSVLRVGSPLQGQVSEAGGSAALMEGTQFGGQDRGMGRTGVDSSLQPRAS